METKNFLKNFHLTLFHEDIFSKKFIWHETGSEKGDNKENFSSSSEFRKSMQELVEKEILKNTPYAYWQLGITETSDKEEMQKVNEAMLFLLQQFGSDLQKICLKLINNDNLENLEIEDMEINWEREKIFTLISQEGEYLQVPINNKYDKENIEKNKIRIIQHLNTLLLKFKKQKELAPELTINLEDAMKNLKDIFGEKAFLTICWYCRKEEIKDLGNIINIEVLPNYNIIDEKNDVAIKLEFQYPMSVNPSDLVLIISVIGKNRNDVLMMLSSNTQIPRIMQALNLILQEEAVLNRREEELQKKWKNINKKEDEFLKYVETIDREFANTLRINNILDISARKRKLQMLDQFLAL